MAVSQSLLRSCVHLHRPLVHLRVQHDASHSCDWCARALLLSLLRVDRWFMLRAVQDTTSKWCTARQSQRRRRQPQLRRDTTPVCHRIPSPRGRVSAGRSLLFFLSESNRICAGYLATPSVQAEFGYMALIVPANSPAWLGLSRTSTSSTTWSYLGGPSRALSKLALSAYMQARRTV